MAKPAIITHASLKSAQLVLQDEIMQWDDVRMVITSTDPQHQGSEIYGKVLSATHVDEGIEALVRFTSVSPGAYRLLRQMLTPAHEAKQET
jgi:hypothetical protein